MKKIIKLKLSKFWFKNIFDNLYILDITNNALDIITIVYLHFKVKHVEISQSSCIKDSLKTSYEKIKYFVHCVEVIL
jgi:hypothetical protein